MPEYGRNYLLPPIGQQSKLIKEARERRKREEEARRRAAQGQPMTVPTREPELLERPPFELSSSVAQMAGAGKGAPLWRKALYRLSVGAVPEIIEGLTHVFSLGPAIAASARKVVPPEIRAQLGPLGGIGTVEAGQTLYQLAIDPQARETFKHGAREALKDVFVRGRQPFTNVDYWLERGAHPLYAYTRGIVEDALTDPLTYIGLGEPESFVSAVKAVKAGAREMTPALIEEMAERAPDVLPRIVPRIVEGMESVAERAFELVRAHGAVPERAVDLAAKQALAKASPEVQDAFAELVKTMGPDFTDRILRAVADPATQRAVQSSERYWRFAGIPIAKAGTARRLATSSLAEPLTGPAYRALSTGTRRSEMASETVRMARSGPMQLYMDLIDHMRRAGFFNIAKPESEAIVRAATYMRMAPESFVDELVTTISEAPEILPRRYPGVSVSTISKVKDDVRRLLQTITGDENLPELVAKLGDDELARKLQPLIAEATEAKDPQKAAQVLTIAAFDHLRNTVAENHLRLGIIRSTRPRAIGKILRNPKVLEELPPRAAEVVRRFARRPEALRRALSVGEDFGLAGTPDYEALLDVLTRGSRTLHYGELGLPVGRVPTLEHLKFLLNKGLEMFDVWGEEGLADDLLKVIREDYIPGLHGGSPGDKPLIKWVRKALYEEFGTVAEQDVRKVASLITAAPRKLAREAERDLDMDVIRFLLRQSEGDDGHVANYLHYIAKRAAAEGLPAFRGPMERDFQSVLFEFSHKVPAFAKQKYYQNPLRAVWSGLNTNLDWGALVAQRGKQQFLAKARKQLAAAAMSWGVPEEMIRPEFDGWITLLDAARTMNVDPKSVSRLWPELRGLKFHPDEALALIRATNFHPINEVSHVFWRWFYDPYIRSWKAGATVANWGWAMVNMQGNMVNCFLAGLTDPRRFLIGAAAAAEEGSKWERMFGRLATKVAPDLITEEAGQFLLKLPDRRMPLASLREIAKRNAWYSGWASTALNEVPDTAFGQINKVLNTTMNPFSPEWLGWLPTRTFARWNEDVSKLALGIDRLLKGDHPIEAGRLIRRALIDYADLTTAEKQIFRRVFPFWSWMRNNFAFQVSTLIEHPGRWRIPPQMIADLRAFVKPQKRVPTELMPEYYHEEYTAQLPFEVNGNPVFMVFRLPAADVGKLLSAQELLASMGPWKLPLELWANKSAFYGGPIDWRKRYAPEGAQEAYVGYEDAPFWATVVPKGWWTTGWLAIGKNEKGEDVLKISSRFRYAMESLFPVLGRVGRLAQPRRPGGTHYYIRVFGKNVQEGWIDMLTGTNQTVLDLTRAKQRLQRKREGIKRGRQQQLRDLGLEGRIK